MHIDASWINREKKLEFSRGLLEGMYLDSLEATRDYIPSTLGCLRGVLFGLWSFVSSPVKVSKELIATLEELGECLRKANCAELAEITVMKPKSWVI
jgi:hypothetical protein